MSSEGIGGFRKMDRRRVGIASIAVVSILIVAGIIIASPLFAPTPFSGFEWGVEVGDTFQFDVRTIGTASGGIYSAGEIHTLNETTIEVTIDELPSVDGAFDPISFSQDIVLFMKVSCTFANGSSIPYHLDDILCEGISGCILPIGNWAGIATMIPNGEPIYDPSTQQMFSVLYDDYLYLMYWWYGDYDDSGGWWGDSSLDDGRPLNVLWQYTHQSPTIYIELTLV
ncbi:MAG: hypothetical protein ACW98Y_14650 [Candidatus Thorarchaeota archaeon]|jgi:hypothetical protein